MKPIIEILDATTGKVQRREMTDAEFEQYQKDIAADAKLREEQHKLKLAAETKKQAIIEKLGLTLEEAKLILNG